MRQYESYLAALDNAHIVNTSQSYTKNDIINLMVDSQFFELFE